MTTALEPQRRWTRVIREDAPTDQLIAWTLERFGAERTVLTTSFGMEGCALIDLYAAHGVPLTVVYLDTMFFFPETYELRDRLAERYPHLRFVNRGTTLTPEQQETHYGPALWKNDHARCCQLRKIEPMREALADVDVWITGITRSQTESRAEIPLIGWDWQFQVLKICPLAHWDRAQIWEYVQSHGVPYNPLHEKGYPSISCTHCTEPVSGVPITLYSRRGRWSGTQKTECGIHLGEWPPNEGGAG